VAKRAKPQTEEVQKWLSVIKTYDTEFAQWQKRVDKILQRYRDEKRQADTTTDNQQSRFNILWANVQTLVPATFARIPQPDVSRRFSDRDPVGRVAAMILERALDFEVQHYTDYRSTMRQSVMDRFLGGRGTAWARYEPHIKAGALQQPIDGDQITEDVDQPGEELDYECAPVDYVHWKDFGHSVARTWEEVTSVWRKVYMTRDACVARFGEKVGSKIPLDATPDDMHRGEQRNEMGNPEMRDSMSGKRACVYEIWDKENEEAIWLAKTMKDILDRKDDPMNLEGFFPCPRPLYATMTNESLIPVPDFTLYQDQANELDVCADRIDGLLKALQVKGVYDASLGVEIARLFTDATNTDLRPVKNWQAFAEKNGLKGAIDIVDLTPIANALKEAYMAMEQIKNQVYEITGIADIVRGQTDPNETLGAQELKGQYATLRLKAMQQDVAVYATELLRLKAQIISGFDQQTLAKIAAVDQLAPEDQQYIGPAMQMIADKVLRNFRIEIAADSLVQIDEAAEKQDRVEFLTAVGTYVGKAAEVGGLAPQLVPLLMELLKFGVTGFKVGKSVEGTIDQALEQMKQMAAQPQAQRPDPEMAKVEATKQIEQAKLQSEENGGKAKLAVERETAAAKIAADKEIAFNKMATDKEVRMHEIQTKAVSDNMRHDKEMQFQGKKHDGEMQMQQTKHAGEMQMQDKKLSTDSAHKTADRTVQADQQEKDRALQEKTAADSTGAKNADSMTKAMGEFAKGMREFAQAQKDMAAAISADRELVRGPDGRAKGTKVVKAKG
jgi:hypothetical protein